MSHANSTMLMATPEARLTGDVGPASAAIGSSFHHRGARQVLDQPDGAAGFEAVLAHHDDALLARESLDDFDEAGVREASANGASLRLNCDSGFGTATFVTGTFGFVAAGHVVRQITEREHPKGAEAQMRDV